MENEKQARKEAQISGMVPEDQLKGSDADMDQSTGSANEQDSEEAEGQEDDEKSQ